MAKNEANFTCDIHGGSYATRSALRGNLGLYGDSFIRIYGDVCDGCIRKIADLIEINFPKSKFVSPELKPLAREEMYRHPVSVSEAVRQLSPKNK